MQPRYEHKLLTNIRCERRRGTKKRERYLKTVNHCPFGWTLQECSDVIALANAR